MPAKASKRLVIDADVLLSAGGENATHSRAISCRDFLTSVLKVCHKVVTTSEMTAEWKKKSTKKEKGRRLQAFASKWLRSMNARKKRIFLTPTQNASLRNRVKKSASKERDLEALLNDIHLIEAALGADGILISFDEEARRLFQKAAVTVGELRDITWVNPENEEEKSIQWLDAGAPKDDVRLLGHSP